MDNKIIGKAKDLVYVMEELDHMLEVLPGIGFALAHTETRGWYGQPEKYAEDAVKVLKNLQSDLCARMEVLIMQISHLNDEPALIEDEVKAILRKEE